MSTPYVVNSTYTSRCYGDSRTRPIATSRPRTLLDSSVEPRCIFNETCYLLVCWIGSYDRDDVVNTRPTLPSQ